MLHLTSLLKIKSQLLKLTEDYIAHLREDADLAQLEPLGYATCQHFYAAIVQDFMTLDIYRRILNGAFIEMPKDVKMFYKAMNSYFWGKLVEDHSPLLFAEEKSVQQKILDRFCHVFTDFGLVDLKTLVSKLRIAASLKKTLTEEIKHKNKSETFSPEQDEINRLTRFQTLLNEHHKTLMLHRNKRWDIFYNTVSFILFPIALCRAAYSKLTRGFWDFKLSYGDTIAKLGNKLAQINDASLSPKTKSPK